MYRVPIALLWTSTATFAAIAITDAIYNYAGPARGLWIGFACTSFLSVIVLYVGRAIINANTRRNSQLAGDIVNDVENLRAEVAEVRDWAEAAALVHGGEPNDGNDDRPLATVHHIHLNRDGQELIAGASSHYDIDPDSIFTALDAADTGTLPGTGS